jgi:hypothetical protein
MRLEEGWECRSWDCIRQRRWTLLTISYFATYELLKKKLSPVAPTIPGTGEKAAAPPLSIGAVMLAGGTAGVAMWSVAIPPDVSLASEGVISKR